MKQLAKNIILTIFIPAVCFGFALLSQEVFAADALVPMIFVLAVFLTSLTTDGYLWGILASLLCVLAVNFAFTFPYLRFNFFIPVNLFSALVMLSVAILTSTLTTKIKQEEHLRAEAELERIRANLLRAVSHDLRTPLTSIYGSCSAILENYEQITHEQKQKLLGEMSDDAQWLIRMVENLLSITRVGGDNVALVKTPTVLEELIDTVLVKFKKRYPRQAVELDIPDSFISIPMDAMLVAQVLNNLLENGVQHAVGMTKLTLRVFTVGNQAVFEISDDGCGVPKSHLPSLFSGGGMKNQVSADKTRQSMGIGLSVCAAIVKAHGGNIEAVNQKNSGLIVRFSLEMEDADYGKE